MCNDMKRPVKRSTDFLFVIILIIFSFRSSIFAQSPEEMRMLELFYEEKDLVITPTRYPKPIHQVAENITVIYSEDIEAMNAHTVADILRWIPGVFVNTSQDFGASSILGIQGSEDRHVTVLLDGVRWNYLSGGNAETITIPVGIIERIEVIKGPASSAWGSSLGGVVNIITKPNAEKPVQVQAYSSYGEADSLDTRAQISGSINSFGYYFYGGLQESDGLLGNRSVDTPSLFSKFTLTLPRNTGLNFSLGYSEPEIDQGSFPSSDVRSEFDARTLYTNATLDTDLTPRSTLTVSGYYLSQDESLTYNALGLGIVGEAGDLFSGSNYQEKTYGAAASVVWELERHTIVTGAEMNQGDLEQTIQAGDLLQILGLPALSESRPDIFSWALYVNDTLSLDKWAITPGIRIDRNTVSGSFFSPSLGATFRPGNDLLFRGTISRGFHYPPLSYSEGGGFYLDPNPDLKAEEVWSYQAGIETGIVPKIQIKTTLFLHELDKALSREAYGGGPPSYYDIFINAGSLQRRGVEMDIKTETFHHLSLEGSGVYVHFNPANLTGAIEIYAYNLIALYDHPDIVTARLAGHFEDLNLDPDYQANFDDIIWDLNVSKTFALGKTTEARLFITAHNLFDGDQYNFGETQNPSCWFEGGIRFAF